MLTRFLVLCAGSFVFSSAFATDSGASPAGSPGHAPAFTNAIRLAGEVRTPSGVSESMPEMTGGQDHPTMGKKGNKPAAESKKGGKAAPGPSSVSESMPEMTGGQDHPTMGKKANKPVAESKKGGKAAPGPSSVNESMPEMTGGQKHPTMGK